MKKPLRKNIERAVLCGLAASVLLCLAHFNVVCDDLRDNVLRLHIIPNSDSTEDQYVKMLVRDALLAESGDLFECTTSVDEARKKAESATDDFQKIAQAVLSERGLHYQADVSVESCYFETRVYPEFTLPAGYYESLVIRLGKAQGQNWWCVIFPAVCLPAASSGKLSDSVNPKSSQIAESPESYEIRFAAVELYENLRNFFRK